MKKTKAILIVVSLMFVPALFADAGADLFKTKCAMCHGQMGNARTPLAEKQGLRDLASPEVQKLTDEELIEVVANGRGPKKAAHAYKAKGISDEQIKALVAYIRTLKK
ncbi:MAG TPA: cytochrome c [Thermoanaerobaculia bacterium]|nr:cytochrome c [Thermoanaerobaculia bacterium]